MVLECVREAKIRILLNKVLSSQENKRGVAGNISRFCCDGSKIVSNDLLYENSPRG